MLHVLIDKVTVTQPEVPPRVLVYISLITLFPGPFLKVKSWIVGAGLASCLQSSKKLQLWKWSSWDEQTTVAGKPWLLFPLLCLISPSHTEMWEGNGVKWEFHGMQLLWGLLRTAARIVLARGGCKQALRTIWCSQAPPVHPSASSVPWREASQLKGHFNPASGDVCCSSCSTHDTRSLPGPAGYKQICSLPPTCNAMLSPRPCTRQAEMGFLILTPFPASVRHFPPECSCRAGFSFLLCLLSSHIKLERPFWSLTHSATESKPPWFLEGKLPPFSGFSGITLCGNAWNHGRNEDFQSCAKKAKPIPTDPHVSCIQYPVAFWNRFRL